MEASKAEGKRSMKQVAAEEDGDDDEDVGEESKKRRALTLSGEKATGISGPIQPSCQVDDCSADMKDSKPYHRRHKVCEHHSKAPIVLVAGVRQRFCQQCSRFHDLSEFDEAKRSCRRRLAGHNERRRKSSYDSRGEG
ncbi:unnamed protein product [Coffea canephora]|uniref:Squamosa promoter-binding-like protein n=2 Tax=Coffea TaxID=13442 RepID=A0A068TTY6_COFCA|nr:squamosa promoter-binding protein 1 [Coffea arabica]CDO99517.1 unnamed protein product [Coffea canephora]